MLITKNGDVAVITFPLWFKIYLAWSLPLLIWETYFLFAKDRRIDKIRKMPNETKANIVQANYRVIKIVKLFFWASPILFILMPYILIKENNLELLFYYSIMIIMLYIVIIECFLICKSIVVEFEQNK